MIMAVKIIVPLLLIVLPFVLASNSDSADTWRCGIFFAGNPGTPPRAKIFILPKKFPADCNAPRVDTYNGTCYEVMRKGLKEWNFENPSRIRKQSGHTIGDDLCGPIPRDIKAPGLEMGFYFAYCGSDWIDTGLRKPERLCCRQRKQVPC
ncbi:hypothetical protein GHT06_021123 [Daphnia sinensis]|uniref:Uncharacterized protein n=1 Tax=Daphnia sinensis TaxID=1820382 RepID=A0AAD5KIN0_9CRUS|nr:hypothetical protein GHT06_021123 [Daphnia sinensis]